MPIYPKFIQTDNGYQTEVRKEKSGIWYKATVNTEGPLDVFLEDVYHFIILGEVTDDLKSENNLAVFQIDFDQRSEVQRLTDILMS